MKNSSQSSRPMIEGLESRTLLSASAPLFAELQASSADVVAQPAVAATATVTKVSVNSNSLELGQPMTITVQVSKARRSHGTPNGRVNFLYYTGKRGTTFDTVKLNSKGQATLYYTPAYAIWQGKYTFGAKYVGNSSYSSSQGNKETVTVSIPKITYNKAGLGTATVQAGSGTAITDTSSYHMDYTGFLTTGQIFDATNADGGTPLAVTNDSGLITGWEEGVVGMKLGEIRVLDIPGSLAYGNNPPSGTTSTGATIPDNAELVFVVQLVSVP